MDGSYGEAFQEGTERMSGSLAANRKEKGEALLSAVLSLPETLREPMYLYYYEHFNTLEIAEVLLIEPENVRNRMSRARKKLKKQLGVSQLDHLKEVRNCWSASKRSYNIGVRLLG
ncbi:sigma factor-like helix-turn-helix DNA-binding protein [Paenibacillus sp. DMB20]|uniref:sigma factor-like helix-turn-helix DNA-binding protein n=1 Tax=Paenibacillus sp. DMB20 TaxID=1642570 RepID=UPI0009E2DAD3|nr:sigma factor-like helix-turn-helix DNA-binding protein [Paenibacillus sp. DMB20]